MLLLLLLLVTTRWNPSLNLNISLTERSIGTVQKLPFGVYTAIEQNHITTSCKLKHTPLDVIIVGCRCYICDLNLLTPNGQFLDCATIGFSVRDVCVQIFNVCSGIKQLDQRRTRFIAR